MVWIGDLHPKAVGTIAVWGDGDRVTLPRECKDGSLGPFWGKRKGGNWWEFAPELPAEWGEECP